MSTESQQTSKSSDQYPARQDDKQDTPIVYDKIEKHDDHVTGVATYKDPQGFGKFTIRVSGNEAGIRDYAAEARIVNLQAVPLRQVDTRAASEQRRTAAEYWRKGWRQRIERLQKFVDEAEVELLANPDRLWQIFRDFERAETDFRARPIWGQDRLIQIEPPGELTDGEAYWFTMTIDPSVNNYGTDYYPLWSSGSWSWPTAQSGSVSAGEYAVYSERTTNRYVAVHETAGAHAEYTITVNGIYYR